MKTLSVKLALVSFIFLSCACHRTASLLPNVSGKAGEVLVVIDKAGWEGEIGTAVRSSLASECPFLVTKESLYTLTNVAPGSFTDMFKVHRNILLVQTGVDSCSFVVKQDVWAQPQCVVQLSAPDSDALVALIGSVGPKIAGAIEQAERDRVIRNTMLYEEKDLYPIVAELFGGSPHFPMGYKLKKKTDDFVWIADEKQYTIQGVLIYRYPVDLSGDPFSQKNMIAHRNQVLMENVPGMFEGSYMTTEMCLSHEFLRFRGRDFAQVYGQWGVVNDFMGGPFSSQSFYSQDGADIIAVEAFVYAPKFDKRQYLRQVEAIAWSWEWEKK